MMKSRKSIPTPNEIILAVDPGFDRVGLAVMTTDVRKPRILFSQCLETNSKQIHATRLTIIGDSIRKIIKKWQPQSLAIETLFFNTNTTYRGEQCRQEPKVSRMQYNQVVTRSYNMDLHTIGCERTLRRVRTQRSSPPCPNRSHLVGLQF